MFDEFSLKASEALCNMKLPEITLIYDDKFNASIRTGSISNNNSNSVRHKTINASKGKVKGNTITQSTPHNTRFVDNTNHRLRENIQKTEKLAEIAVSTITSAKTEKEKMDGTNNGSATSIDNLSKQHGSNESTISSEVKYDKQQLNSVNLNNTEHTNSAFMKENKLKSQTPQEHEVQPLMKQAETFSNTLNSVQKQQEEMEVSHHLEHASILPTPSLTEPPSPSTLTSQETIFNKPSEFHNADSIFTSDTTNGTSTFDAPRPPSRYTAGLSEKLEMYDTLSSLSSQYELKRTFDQKLYAIHETKDLAQLVSFTQLCIRTIFHECLPAIGFEPSGIRLNTFSRRLSWSIRYEGQLGTLNSFIDTFEDLFFVIHRPAPRRLKKSVIYDNVVVSVGEDGSNTGNGEGRDVAEGTQGDLNTQTKQKQNKKKTKKKKKILTGVKGQITLNNDDENGELRGNSEQVMCEDDNLREDNDSNDAELTSSSESKANECSVEEQCEEDEEMESQEEEQEEEEEEQWQVDHVEIDSNSNNDDSSNSIDMENKNEDGKECSALPTTMTFDSSDYPIINNDYAIINVYRGYVGPSLLYGKLLRRFFPDEMEFPLGAVAEALFWGKFFAPRFGELKSVFAAMGRVVECATLRRIVRNDLETNADNDFNIDDHEEEHNNNNEDKESSQDYANCRDETTTIVKTVGGGDMDVKSKENNVVSACNKNTGNTKENDVSNNNNEETIQKEELHDRCNIDDHAFIDFFELLRSKELSLSPATDVLEYTNTKNNMSNNNANSEANKNSKLTKRSSNIYYMTVQSLVKEFCNHALVHHNMTINVESVIDTAAYLLQRFPHYIRFVSTPLIPPSSSHTLLASSKVVYLPRRHNKHNTGSNDHDNDYDLHMKVALQDDSTSESKLTDVNMEEVSNKHNKEIEKEKGVGGGEGVIEIMLELPMFVQDNLTRFVLTYITPHLYSNFAISLNTLAALLK